MAETHSPKIMHVVLSMHVGGAERLIYDMVKYPIFAERPPIVCCLDAVGDLGEKLRQEGYQVYCKGRRPGLDLKMVWWLRQIIIREQVDVVHAHQYSPLFYAVPSALLAGKKKVIYTEHGRFHPERKSWKRTLFNPLLAQGIDHLVSISEATAQAMATYDNFPLHRIKIIHNGINYAGMQSKFDRQAKRKELGLSPKCRIIGTAARLNSIKNIAMMLRGLKLILEKIPDICLVIAGAGEEEQKLKMLARQIEVEEHVKFIGLRFDLPEIYPLFDVFLLTSFSEGISITLLESMSCGLPSVVTEVGGNREVLVEGLTGFFVGIDDDQLLAQRVCELLQNTKLAARFGEAAQRRIDKEFSLQGMMEKYRQLYS
jgi:glycosyltransferase involved in cell wall biosynthesis